MIEVVKGIAPVLHGNSFNELSEILNNVLWYDNLHEFIFTIDILDIELGHFDDIPDFVHTRCSFRGNVVWRARRLLHPLSASSVNL
jgi:hypothetical protein